MPPTMAPVASPTALLTGTVATPAPSISALDAMCQFLQLCDGAPTKAPSVETITIQSTESPLGSGSLAPTAVASSASLLDLCVKIGLCIEPGTGSQPLSPGTAATLSPAPATPYPSPAVAAVVATSEPTAATSEPTAGTPEPTAVTPEPTPVTSEPTPVPTLDPTVNTPENLCEMAGNCPPSTAEQNEAPTPPKADPVCEFLGNCPPSAPPSVATTAKPENTQAPSLAPTSDAPVAAVTAQATIAVTASPTANSTTLESNPALDLLCATVGLCNLANGQLDLYLGTGSPEPTVNTTASPADTNSSTPAPTKPNLLCLITGIC